MGPGGAPPELRAGSWDGCSGLLRKAAAPRRRTGRRERRRVSAWRSRGLGYQVGRPREQKGCGSDWSLTISSIRYVATNDTPHARSPARCSRAAATAAAAAESPPRAHPIAGRHHAQFVVELATRRARALPPDRSQALGGDAAQRGGVSASGGARPPRAPRQRPGVSRTLRSGHAPVRTALAERRHLVRESLSPAAEPVDRILLCRVRAASLVADLLGRTRCVGG